MQSGILFASYRAMRFPWIGLALSFTLHAATGPGAPENILPQLHEINAAEIDVGRTAVAQACDFFVKSYGQKVLDDQSKSDADLSVLALQRQVNLGPVLMGEEFMDIVGVYQHLDKAADCGFDRLFLVASVRGQDFAIQLVKGARDHATDNDVKIHLDLELDTLKAHRQMALDLLNDLPLAPPPVLQ